MVEKSTKIERLDEGIRHGWKLLVDGQPVEVNEMAVLVNDRLGTLIYGKSPSGEYDQWAFHEVGGGGSVIIPYSMIDNQLFIGVVTQTRPLQSGEPVANVPRGFMDPDKSHFQAASSELAEEMGLDIPVIDLGGEGGNPNNAFFETWGENEGVNFWAVKVPADKLVGGEGEYGFKPGVVKPVEGDKMAERILGSKFIPLAEAGKLGDMMTTSAVTRLLNHLVDKGEITIFFGSPSGK
ncbi:hypothetical protein A2193_03355 [Candidatus Azambacteria bacterium RIFOXYA1_FULL_42_37]|nr:MAG: hypothetical protein A2193_03355 [Candidatus Azambacteria bacterium RIFOXYA1_FULL_42_37]